MIFKSEMYLQAYTQGLPRDGLVLILLTTTEKAKNMPVCQLSAVFPTLTYSSKKKYRFLFFLLLNYNPLLFRTSIY